MESLGQQVWDAVLSGTGLTQSLLALALSRSNKRILHLDANDFYGEHEAALSLQEADAWANAHAGNTLNSDTRPIFQRASVWKHLDAEAQGLSFPRAYSLALAPQIVYTKSNLLSQLVSSRAYRQVEFLAVGSFFVFNRAGAASNRGFSRIPSSREDVFAAQSIPARSKRALMKFLKFVVDYDSEDQKPIWQEKADESLSSYLADAFKLDADLRDSLIALTLALDEKITVKDGLAKLHRHLTSTGLFGPGFCAVYPKWGGLSEVAQVGCRAGAVGGGIYMLDTVVTRSESGEDSDISLQLSKGVTVKTPIFVTSQQTGSADTQRIARLVVILNSSLELLFRSSVEGTPTPAVAVVAFPPDSLGDTHAPVYAFVHSSDTGECPKGQSVIYLTVLAASGVDSSHILDIALTELIQHNAPSACVLYKMYYEQVASDRQPIITPQRSATVFEFPSPSLGLSFDDTSLDAVKEAWKLVMKNDAVDDEYMKFEDREGMEEEDVVFD
ncbi:GDP dissociation inhibitor [Xylariaceae sp. FL0594]|nr:GDP dissociation inhibitor [Xylariaceae sp. FL0594]